jgi:aryl-alcohol dehydrogenase-like predicted oxidoreductase
MEFRRLGRNGLTLSAVAYGNWITHGAQVEDDTALDCVRAALEEGITTFDSADAYADGRAEEVLGRAIIGQRRESLEICTKVFFPVGPPTANNHGLGRKHITEAVNGSLKRLQTDYIDLYQAHRFDEKVPLEETMSALADLVHAGKVLYLGVSEWTADQLRQGVELARELHVPLVSNQPQYSMLWRVIEAEVVPASQALGLGQIVWSPIAQGVLSGKYKPGFAPPAGSRATDEASGARMISRWLDQPGLLERVAQLEPIAADVGLSMAALAVAWVLQNENVTSAIIGASRPEQVRDNVKAAGVILDQDVLNRIDEALGDLIERDPARTGSTRAATD